ncbi:unnamed protein product [Lymnaea stagnalis]|uniref:PARP catalytic domain-containing protein n=1 Tax=Lymnaea stagnalis TaxID=6523 RepID=A0AAV2IKY3_LYMST
MASKTHVQRYIDFINHQMDILKGERKTVLEAADDAIHQLESEIDAWVVGGLVNQTTCAQMNNRISQVITLFMAKSVEISDLEIKENESDLNQTSSASSNDSLIPKASYTNEEVQERTTFSRDETLNKSGVDIPYVTTTRIAILEEAVFSLKKTTEQVEEKQENFNKKLEILANTSLKSTKKIKERLAVLEKTNQHIASTVDDLFETVKNVDVKLNISEEENKSVNVSINELNKQISSVRTCSNDALIFMQDLAKSVDGTYLRYNEMSNKMNQLEISIDLMSTQYKGFFENMIHSLRDKRAHDDLIGMVCQLISKRLAPLETLNKTLHKKLILSKEHISKSHSLTVLVGQLKELWDGIQKISGNKLTIELKSYAVTFEELTSLIKTRLSGLQQVDIVVDGTKEEPLKAEANTDVKRSQMEALIFIALIQIENEKILNTLEKKQDAWRHTEDVSRIILALKTVTSVTAEITECLLKRTILELNSEPTLSKMVELNQDIKSQENLTLNERHTITEADIFCKLLGLNHEIGEMLWSLDESQCLHQTTFYFIERWMEDAEKEINDEEVEFTGALSGNEASTEKREKLISVVQHLGLTKETAEQLFSTIPIEYIDLQTPSYWIMRYITNIIECHPVFTNVNRYIYSEDTTGEWFKEIIELTDTNEMRDTSTFKIKMINHDASEKSKTAVKSFLEEIQTEEHCEVLFHGTDHTSAKSIIEEGILISKGKPCQDFSSNDGFYLSDSYEKAREWSSIGRKHHHAVLVLKVETSLLEADGVKRLDLSGDKKQWEELVTFCRKGCIGEKTKKRLLGGVEFIKGPMCLNGRGVAKGKHAIGFGRNDNLQMCVRDDDYAKWFGLIDNITGVIFL